MILSIDEVRELLIEFRLGQQKKAGADESAPA